MQVTIDSSEPLSTVMTVVGALYGVELRVADGTASPEEPRRRRAIAASASAKKSAGRAKRAGRKVDAKVVRQWAVEQGISVSARGQLPKSVLQAYTDANA